MPFSISTQLHRNVSRFEALGSKGRKIVKARVGAIDPKALAAALEAGTLAKLMQSFGNQIIGDLGTSGAAQDAINAGASAAEGVLIASTRRARK